MLITHHSSLSPLAPLFLAGVGIAPLVVGGLASGVSKLLSSLFGHKSKVSAAKEQNRAAKETFHVGEGSRINRNAASQALLSSLFGGKYAVDPTAFSAAQQEKPYTGADPSKGIGWGTAAGIAGGVGNLADSYMLSKYPAPPVSPTVMAAGDAAAQDVNMNDLAGAGDLASNPFPAPTPDMSAPGQAGIAGQQFSLTPWLDNERR